MQQNPEYNKDTLTNPIFLTSAASGGGSTNILNASANFYRNSMNTNIELDVGIGTESSGIWTSSNVFLPVSTFNLIADNDAIEFVNNVDVKALKLIDFNHDLLIQYKLTKSDGNNYINSREIRTQLVSSDGITPYTEATFYNNVPDTGSHDIILINGTTSHAENDEVKIRFNIIQNENLSGHSGTKITIFRISWNIICTGGF